MELSFDVRFQKTYVYRGARTTTYWVRWSVGGKPFKEPFKDENLAEGFRNQLVAAAGRGEGFDVATGRPVSMRQQAKRMGWYEFACKFVDMKWPKAAATSRRSTAEAMVTVTCAMLNGVRGRPDQKAIRSALLSWAFNTSRRGSGEMPEDVEAVLRWVSRNTRDVSELASPAVLRPVMDALALKVDGKSQVAATVVGRKRAQFHGALEYAVELELLARNPIPHLKWKLPKIEVAVDPRVAPSPIQARTLLLMVKETPRSGPHLYAAFACTYYSALRPEEVLELRERNIHLPRLELDSETGEWVEPEDGWGEFILEETAPYAGSRWTDDGKGRDKRGLKARPRKAVRRVPIPPPLVRILRDHFRLFGVGSNGEVFRGVQGGPVPVSQYNKTYRRARVKTFTKEVAAGPLARRPYDLRHACVSTQLNAGVEVTKVALWAGQSVEVLLKIYAKVIYGGDDAARKKILEAYR